MPANLKALVLSAALTVSASAQTAPAKTGTAPFMAGTSASDAQVPAFNDQASSSKDQVAAPTPTLNAQARLVNLPVVVRDKKGALVQTLTKDDFTLEVDGKPQSIRYFDQDANLPLTLGLLVDISQSQRSVLDEERTASETFLEKMLTPDRDKAFIIQFAGQTELLQDVTSSRPKLQAALKEIDTPSPAAKSDDDDDASRRSRRGTVLYDAAFLASDEVLAKQKGRKAVILLTDGADRNSRETITAAIEAAQRADTTMYAIYFKGEEPHRDDDRQRGSGFPRGGGGYPGGGGGYPRGRGGGGYPGGRGGNLPDRVDGKKILEQMTSETGGRMFEVKKKQNMADIYTQIGDELRAQYRLGFTPEGGQLADGYHKLILDLKDGKRGSVQTREGYYSGK